MFCFCVFLEKFLIKFFKNRFFLKKAFLNKDLRSVDELIRKFNIYPDIFLFIKECTFNSWDNNKIDNFISKKFITNKRS